MAQRKGLEGARILIIEDDGLIAADIADMLLEFGCLPAGIAPTVTDALKIINSGAQADCATLDVRLDTEIAGAVGGARISKGIPFVVVSAYEISLRDFQHIPTLKKPVTKEQLRQGLERALGISHPLGVEFAQCGEALAAGGMPIEP
jgi:DNA-binding LytR/AlgR family response regulator